MHIYQLQLFATDILFILVFSKGIGIRGLMANFPQGNQELLVVRDKVGRPHMSLG